MKLLHHTSFFLFTVLLLSSPMQSWSQAFFPAYQGGLNALKKAEGKIVLNDASVLTGKIIYSKSSQGITAVTLFDAEGNKKKYKAKDVKAMYLKGGKLSKWLSAMDQGSFSLKEGKRVNFKDFIDTEYFVWKRILNRKGKPVLLQLANPGFDSKIQVFIDPSAKETGGLGVAGVKLTGGLAKSYYITKGGSASTYVKKNKYEKAFSSLYPDCTTMTTDFKKVKWADFAKHVFVYEQYCE